MDRNGYCQTVEGIALAQGKYSAPSAVVAQPRRLRVALVAGLVGERGAEKQLVYMARALDDVGVHVRIYSLKKEVGFYGPLLGSRGLEHPRLVVDREPARQFENGDRARLPLSDLHDRWPIIRGRMEGCLSSLRVAHA